MTAQEAEALVRRVKTLEERVRHLDARAADLDRYRFTSDKWLHEEIMMKTQSGSGSANICELAEELVHRHRNDEHVKE